MPKAKTEFYLNSNDFGFIGDGVSNVDVKETPDSDTL